MKNKFAEKADEQRRKRLSEKGIGFEFEGYVGEGKKKKEEVPAAVAAAAPADKPAKKQKKQKVVEAADE